MAELTHSELDASCRNNGLTSLLCEQGYMATKEDVLNDNPDWTEDNVLGEDGKRELETSIKQETMFRMLIENLDFGPLRETDDETERDDHPTLMAARDDICSEIADNWVAGKYSGKHDREFVLAQYECNRLVDEWYAKRLFEPMAQEIMKHTNDDITVEDADVAEYLGRITIADFFQTTCAKNADEFAEEVTCGLSGSPLDGSPFGAAEAEAYARDYWEAHQPE